MTYGHDGGRLADTLAFAAIVTEALPIATNIIIATCEEDRDSSGSQDCEIRTDAVYMLEQLQKMSQEPSHVPLCIPEYNSLFFVCIGYRYDLWQLCLG